MLEVIVSMRDNNSRFISASRTFYVVFQKGTNMFNDEQHFDLGKFEKCYNAGIKVIIQP